jgi:hypothetical protein
VHPRIVSTDVNDLIGTTILTLIASGIAAQRLTSVAWRSIGGMVRPRAWAVFRLNDQLEFRGRLDGQVGGLGPAEDFVHERGNVVMPV